METSDWSDKMQQRLVRLESNLIQVWWRCTHRHHRLGHPGEHGGTQRVQQDLAFQQDKVQQRGTVLGAQVHQQGAVVCSTARRVSKERTGFTEVSFMRAFQLEMLQC